MHWYMAMYPISSSLSRPIICRIAVDQAALLGCDAIVHTANQSQNSLRRLNGALHQLGFGGFHGSPYEYSALTRQEKIAELRRAGLTAFQARGTSGDANLWCREFESGTSTIRKPSTYPKSFFVDRPADAPHSATHDFRSIRSGNAGGNRQHRVPWSN